MDAYAKLLGLCRELDLVGKTAALLGWDQETYLPPRGIGFRAEQEAYFSGWLHRRFTAPEVGDWIGAAAAEDGGGDPVRAADLRLLRRDYDRATKVPAELVEALSRATSLAHHAWVEARAKSDWRLFLPHLRQVFDLTRRKAEHIGAGKPYDVLLDLHEPGLTAAAFGALLDQLLPPLVELAGRGAEASRRAGAELPAGPYPEEAQRRLNREVAAAIGFDFAAGRIDTTAHPFCTELGADDIRLTTRYDEADFTASLYGVLHEAGHGLYAQGLPREWAAQPAREAVSLGIHESQSRLWENHVGGSPAFLGRWLGRATELFPQLRGLTPERFWQIVGRCERSFIRVEADEITYDLHIALRFRLERALFAGELALADLPAAWNDEFARLLGLTVPDDRRGCLQDVHWAHGGFGYFPTYTLGNLNGSQLLAAARAADPALADFGAPEAAGRLLAWLRDRIHRRGSLLLPQELMAEATGRPTGPADHLAHLERKVRRLEEA